MAKKNYYAVKVGMVPGIYTTWKECEEQIKRFPNAEYKGFVTLEEAKAYFSNNSEKKSAMKKEKNSDYVETY